MSSSHSYRVPNIPNVSGGVYVSEQNLTVIKTAVDELCNITTWVVCICQYARALEKPRSWKKLLSKQPAGKSNYMMCTL